MDNCKTTELGTLVDKNGKTPKIGDFIRLTLYNGVDNVTTQIKECSRFKYSPSIIKYIEFEIFDGVPNKNDTFMKDMYKF